MSAALEQTTERHAEGCGCVRCKGFEPGNQLAATHRAHASLLTAEEVAEERDLAARLRELLPDPFDADAPAVDGMAALGRRLRLMYVDLEEHGVTREGGKAAPLLKHVLSAERLWLAYCDRFGFHAESRSSLGLRDAQRKALRPRTFDLERLSPEMRARVQALAIELEGLVADAEVDAE